MKRLLALLLIALCLPASAGELGDQLRAQATQLQALAVKVDAEEAETCPAPIVCPVCPVCPKPPDPTTGLTPALSLLSNDTIPSSAPAKPARAGSYTDPTYKTPVTRATAPADSGGTWTRHIYSRQQPYNADGTRYLAQGSNGALVVYDAATFRPMRTLTGMSGSMEPLWSPTNPLLILHTGKSQSGGVFTWRNTDTNAETPAFSLAGKAPFPTATHYRTRGEGTMCADGSKIALMAEIGETFLGVVSVDVKTGAILGSLPAGTLGRPDHVSITPSCRWVVPSWHTNTGTRAYSLNFSTYKQLFETSTHSDLAVGPEGNDYYVYADYSASTGGYVRAKNIDTGASFPLLDLYPASGESTAIHISGQAFKRPGWVTFTTHTTRTSQQAIYKKVMLAQLKPSPLVYNVTHIQGTGTGYWDEPHGVPNRDLTRIMFVTNLKNGVSDSYSARIDWK